MPAKGGHHGRFAPSVSQDLRPRLASRHPRAHARGLVCTAASRRSVSTTPSGPYTDPDADPDLKQGLPPLRQPWILERGDVEELPGADVGVSAPARGRSGARRRAVRPRPAAAARHAGPARHPDALRAPGRDHAGDGVHRPPRGHAGRAGARRGGARPGDHPGQHQPPGDRADDHRPQVPGEDQRQHRQLGRRLLHRGGGREDDAGRPAGAPTR